MSWRMPAEWEPHEATWLGWPHERTDWPGKFTPIQWIYAEIVRHLATREKVRILVNDAAHRRKAIRTLESAGVHLPGVEFFLCPTDRGWLRDSGPIFVTTGGGQVHATNWIFNGWAKYGNCEKDNRVPGFIARQIGVPEIETALVLEGGSVDTDGRGTLLTTEECLLSPVQARNPDLSRDEMEEAFRRYLGITKVLWLGRGIAGDDTHGHVDDIARFVAPGVVVAVQEVNPNHANYEPLQENLERLRGMSDARGLKLQVWTLPMPAPVCFQGQLLPASYANFYIANEVVLVPVFGDPSDRIALNTLAEVFPGRDVTGIYCRDLILGLGAIHCMTQQQPRHSIL